MISQLTFSVTAAATRQIPRTVKKIALRCRPEIIALVRISHFPTRRPGARTGGARAPRPNLSREQNPRQQRQCKRAHGGCRVEG
jgi:hypothetical protein